MKYTAQRHHDISCGHRIVGHESNCRHLHGHNYRIHFVCEAELDNQGRVIDFSIIKSQLCQWLDEHWDHRMILWDQDPLAAALVQLDGSVKLVPFNPTAENMAGHLLREVGPAQLQGTGVTLIRCIVEETRKCSATCEL